MGDSINEKLEIKVADEVANEIQPVPQPKGHFDPLDSLTGDEERECIAKAMEKLRKEHDRELSLAKSDIRMPGQEYVVVSFVGEGLRQKTTELGIKLWGCFGDIPSAQKYAKYINGVQENKDFDVYVMEMYCWTLIPPDPQCMADQEHHDDKLNTLIKAHKVQQYKINQVFDRRKQKLKANPKAEYSEWNYNEGLNEKIMPSEILPKLEVELIREGDESAAEGGPSGNEADIEDAKSVDEVMDVFDAAEAALKSRSDDKKETPPSEPQPQDDDDESDDGLVPDGKGNMVYPSALDPDVDVGLVPICAEEEHDPNDIWD